MLCMPRLRKVCRRCGYLAHARSLDARHHAGVRDADARPILQRLLQPADL